MADAIDSLVHFFNDFVGAVIPGVVLICGIAFEVGGTSQVEMLLKLFSPAYGWIVFLSIAFAVGHILLAIHSILFKWRANKNRKEVESKLKTSAAYRGLEASVVEWRTKQMGGGASENAKTVEIDLHDLRSIAMTISSEAAQLGRRFMFIALFCYGLVMTGIVLLLTALWIHWGEFIACDWLNCLIFAISAAVLIATYKRGEEFERRALVVPFPCAAAELIVPHTVKA